MEKGSGTVLGREKKPGKGEEQQAVLWTADKLSEAPVPSIRVAVVLVKFEVGEGKEGRGQKFYFEGYVRRHWKILRKGPI